MRSDFLQNGPVFLVAETGARGAPPPSERGRLSLTFNRRIRNMSVGRFQLALRALDLRAAPCPRGLLRPSGSVVGAPGHFVAPNPALRIGPQKSTHPPFFFFSLYFTIGSSFPHRGVFICFSVASSSFPNDNKKTLRIRFSFFLKSNP